LGFNKPEDAIGLQIESYYHNVFNIIGVIQNYNHKSLKNNYQPVAISCNEDVLNYYTLRIEPGNMKNTISDIQRKWDKIFKGSPFVYFFMDEYFNSQYKSDQQFRDIALLFALLSIIIASLGLFGLSYYTILKRTKEVGVRKVLGAGNTDIFYLLTKDYYYLIFIAIVVAYPFACIICNTWLSNYAFRTVLSITVFILPALMLILIASATICFQVLKAAKANPVEALKCE
jgi:putative ABC transport system permease protein